MKFEKNYQYYKVMSKIIGEPNQTILSIASNANLSEKEILEAIDYIVTNDLMKFEVSRNDQGQIEHAWYGGYTISKKGIKFMDDIKNEIEKRDKEWDEKHRMPSVFISYNQKSGNDFVNILEEKIAKKAIVHRDKNDVESWGSFKKFMDTIRDNDFAILVITEEYLKSAACLYEVVELMHEKNWNEKTMYVVFESANIYDMSGRAKYIKYWEEKCLELTNLIKSLSLSASVELCEELRKYETVKNKIGEFIKMVADSNNPAIYIAIEEIIKRLENNRRA